jgi:hypothetical protein
MERFALSTYHEERTFSAESGNPRSAQVDEPDVQVRPLSSKLTDQHELALPSKQHL